MFKVNRAIAHIVGSIATLAVLATTQAAHAAGGVQIDTSVIYQVNSPSLCTLGQTCGSGYDLGFNVGLGNGKTFHSVYLYREGVIGLGQALPTGARFGDRDSLGGAWIAPAFAPFTGLDVHVTFALSGGRDHGLARDVNDEALVDWFVFDPKDPAATRGEFQVRFHTDQYGTGLGPPVQSRYGGNPGDPNPGAQGLEWLGDGIPKGALISSNLSGVAPKPPIPEPATWAMLVLGFGLTGLVARRRRSVHSAT